jgi:hypothetical protein
MKENWKILNVITMDFDDAEVEEKLDERNMVIKIYLYIKYFYRKI